MAEALFTFSEQENREILAFLNGGIQMDEPPFDYTVRRQGDDVFLISTTEGDGHEAFKIHRDPWTNVIVFNNGDDFDWNKW